MKDRNNSATGLISSALSSNPYFLMIKDGHIKSGRNNSFKSTFRTIRCKICDESGGTMYKDGDSYICKDCKMLRDLDKEDEE